VLSIEYKASRFGKAAAHRGWNRQYGDLCGHGANSADGQAQKSPGKGRGF